MKEVDYITILPCSSTFEPILARSLRLSLRINTKCSKDNAVKNLYLTKTAVKHNEYPAIFPYSPEVIYGAVFFS